MGLTIRSIRSFLMGVVITTGVAVSSVNRWGVDLDDNHRVQHTTRNNAILDTIDCGWYGITKEQCESESHIKSRISKGVIPPHGATCVWKSENRGSLPWCVAAVATEKDSGVYSTPSGQGVVESGQGVDFDKESPSRASSGSVSDFDLSLPSGTGSPYRASIDGPSTNPQSNSKNLSSSKSLLRDPRVHHQGMSDASVLYQPATDASAYQPPTAPAATVASSVKEGETSIEPVDEVDTDKTFSVNMVSGEEIIPETRVHPNYRNVADILAYLYPKVQESEGSSFSYVREKLTLISNDKPDKPLHPTGESTKNPGGTLTLIRQPRNLALTASNGKNGQNKEVKIWDTDSGECVKTFTGPFGGIVSRNSAFLKGASFSSDYTKILTGSECCGNTFAQIWDVDSGECLHKAAGSGAWEIRANFSHALGIPKGRLEAEKLIPNGPWNQPDYLLVTYLFSPDGSKMLACRHKGKAEVRFLTDSTLANDSSKTLGEVFENHYDNVKGTRKLSGHTQRIGHACFSPDGSKLLTSCGSGDTTARIWDTESGECLQILAGHTGPVRSVAFGPDLNGP